MRQPGVCALILAFRVSRRTLCSSSPRTCLKCEELRICCAMSDALASADEIDV
jgi:hypothetical protein